MPIIKPISDLRNHFNEISEICHKEGEPVFITKNGEGNLVVMSMAAYERERLLFDLYKKLLEAEMEDEKDYVPHREVMKRLKRKLDE